jgi:membrane protein implicated in regulation of membrane protease activity
VLEGIDWGILLWLLAGILSAVGELLTGTFFLIPFAIGAFVAAGLVMVGVDPIWVVAVFLVVTLLVLILVIRFGRRARADQPATREGANRYVDARGFVTGEIAGREAGRVRVGAESWRAVSSTGEPIPSDAAVRVVAVRGNTLVVELE